MTTPLGFFFKYLKRDEFKCPEKKDLIEYYVSLYASDEERVKKIEKCFSFDNKKTRAIESENSEFIKLVNNSLNFKYSLQAAHRYILKLREYNNILARITEAYLYMLSNNKSRSEAILLNLTKVDMLEHTVNSDIQNLALEKINDLFIKILKKFQKEELNSDVLDTFIHYVYYNSSAWYRRDFAKSFDVKERVLSIRKKYTSYVYGESYPFTWIPAMIYLDMFSELSTYLQSKIVKKEISKSITQKVKVLSYVTSESKKLRDSFLDGFKRLKQKNDIYSRSVYFNLVERPEIFKLILSHGHGNLGMLSNKKRKFYIKLLNNKMLQDLAIFNLFLLGDVDDSYLRRLRK